MWQYQKAITLYAIYGNNTYRTHSDLHGKSNHSKAIICMQVPLYFINRYITMATNSIVRVTDKQC